MAYRILSCDGGGIRGLMTALWLSRLEKQLGGPLREYFDLISGTSTGSILGCGIAMGMPAEEILQIYLDRGTEVFPPFRSRFWERLQRTLSDGLSAPRYDGKGLEHVLRDAFGKTKFGELQVHPTLAISYDTFSRRPVVFKNTKTEHAELPVWEVVRSSAAAPVYFPAHVLNLGRAESPMIDGGVVANNPTACAIAEGVRHTRELYGPGKYDVSSFVVASFGTGQMTRRITAAQAREWGGLQWALPVLDVMFDGGSGAVDYIARQLLSDDKYFRFQCPLDEAYDDLDNATGENLNALMATAEDYLINGGDLIIQRLVEALQPAPEKPIDTVLSLGDEEATEEEEVARDESEIIFDEILSEPEPADSVAELLEEEIPADQPAEEISVDGSEVAIENHEAVTQEADPAQKVFRVDPPQRRSTIPSEQFRAAFRRKGRRAGV